MRVIKSFFKQRPLISAVLLVIILAASFVRLWKLEEAFHFMGDQGRDALIVSRIFTEGDLVFVGPVMSVGNIYLGPFYYYFMLPFLFVSYPSPVGPVVAVALVNIFTVFLLYFLGRKLVGERAGLLAAGMMALSAVAIVHSRFSWNPNIIPLVSLLLMVCTYYALTKSPKFWIVAAACVGILIQLHYVTLLSAVAAGLIYVWQLWQNRKRTSQIKVSLVSGLLGLAIIAALLSPLLLFDMKHNWLNLKALQGLLVDEKNFVQANERTTEGAGTVIRNIVDRASLIVSDKVVGKHETTNQVLIVILATIVGIGIRFSLKNKQSVTGISLLIVYLVTGIIGFSFYEKDIYDHYIVYLLPATFLVIGYCLDRLIRAHFLGWIPVTIFLIAFARHNIPQIEFKAGGPTQDELRVTAESIHSRVAEGEPYAIVLLSESKDSYGMNYRYFLNVEENKRPVDPERNGDAQKLFIINEERKTDKPQNAEIYEIVTFGSTDPVEVYSLPHGISVSVLSKNRSSNP